MKKKMIQIGAAAIVAVIIFFVGWYVMNMHFGKGPAFPFVRAMELEYDISAEDVPAAEPLMTLAESEEEAKQIAEQYGITFVSFQSGVATYTTEEDPLQVIERGEKNGYPELYLNQKRELQNGQISGVDSSILEQEFIAE